MILDLMIIFVYVYVFVCVLNTGDEFEGGY